jgi:hypothetical protein
VKLHQVEKRIAAMEESLGNDKKQQGLPSKRSSGGAASKQVARPRATTRPKRRVTDHFSINIRDVKISSFGTQSAIVQRF